MEETKREFEILFRPGSTRGGCQENESLLDAARRLSVDLDSVCGGSGKCRRCKVRILSGRVSPHTAVEQDIFSPEELAAGWRLACQTHPAGNCEIDIPPESMSTLHRMQVDGLDVTAAPDPPVQAYHVELSVPHLSDLRADADRLLGALNQDGGLRCSRIDIDVLRTISPRLRSWDWQCQAAVRNDEVVAIAPWPSRRLGLAIDLGTTKIAGYLMDMAEGRTLAARGIMNPQTRYGDDVISRIDSAIKSPAEGGRLQKLVADALNEMASELCSEVGADTTEIVEMVVAGNTAMHHLFLGLPVKQLGHAPFVPAVRGMMDVKARDLDIHISPGAYVHMPPNIAGYVGADHVTMLLATEVWQMDGTVLALDIGTNTEVSLVHNGEITAVSCASGPAFEGGHITDGMRAASGAIERVRIDNNGVHCSTIDGARPVGICGSGVLDAVAQLHIEGIIDDSGKMLDGHPRVRTSEKHREFVLVDEDERAGRQAIVITQQDVREIQLAKAAIRTGIQALIETDGCSEDAVSRIVIAGAFGTYINVSSAVAIGMLPPLPADRFEQVGNAAGAGARLTLISAEKRSEALTVANRVHYLELTAAPHFQETFIRAIRLGQQ